ncbi:MAG TPA: glycosyltransferase [Candidatus Angelobacter sp.]|nr:glycosyltransferase [Candidatus Angelobacter sp.]
MSNRLALSMIVRNGEQDLPHCLESVRGIVDEIVIADTGSTDASIAIAQSFGAQIIHVPWTNDFAAARNAALQPVTAEWVLSLDADEQLDELTRSKIASAMEAQNTDGYLVPIRNYVHTLNERLWDRAAIPNDGLLERAKDFAGYLEHENVRLFRRKPEIYFVGRVHETVGTRIEKSGGKLQHATFIIHHFGFAASAERKAEKNHFYRELGRQKIQEMPRNAQAHFELGLVELDNFQNHEEAVRLFARACDLDPKLAVAWFFQGVAFTRLQRDANALPCFARARRLGLANTSLAEMEADALYNCKQFDESRKAYRRALDTNESTEVLSKLGLTEIRLGRVESGIKKIMNAISKSPAAPELHDRLVAAYLSLGRVIEAAQAAESKLHNTKHTESSFMRTAALWMHGGRPGRALEIICNGIKEFPGSAGLQQAFAELKTPEQQDLQAANVAAT